MRLYGLASHQASDVLEFYTSRDEAEAALRKVLAEVPQLADDLWVVEVRVDVSSN